MKNIIFLIFLALSIYMKSFCQDAPLNPLNHNANIEFLTSETYNMEWIMLKDSTEVKIGEIETQIKKEKELIYFITSVNIKQSSTQWIDSTVISSDNLKPIYHSSFNQNRDMVLKFDDNITGYYFDKQTNTKTQILEETNKPFFDSNFYPQLIRLLPLAKDYSTSISIFDYNPDSKIGVIKATIKNTTKIKLDFDGKTHNIWKVETTDDISDNSVLNTYYIEVSKRKILKQEIDFGGKKMIMRLID
ncbi:hypothetical protein [Winogradskyella sp. SYSU M77433]|uniref:DUF3108 domain-containing protein n=1 Tax=Winogradskyella sp. SYSU M77433 TaxID=3042722 RepID=UPI0024817BF4|nr:hypothetical protein [Winogradskyella sp. SYSU M77433]MDH7913576.1 hypothetical protein [Winogradskyella sp. SYSU M77433]